MKRTLLICSIALLPFLAFAQNNSPLNDEFYTNLKGVSSVIRMDNNINVMQVNTSNDSFELIALNENQQTIWRTTIAGYGVKIGKFKNKIAAVSASEHSMMVGNSNSYKGYIIDPATGKTLAEKVIYEDNNDYVEIPNVMIGDNYFKFAIRQTEMTRALHVGIPIFVAFQVDSWKSEYNSTKKLDIIDLNERLEATNTIHPVPSGQFITLTCNKNSDTFVSWLNGPDLEIYKYEAGKTQPSGKLNADVSLKPIKSFELATQILLLASDTKPNNLFYAFIFRNEDKEPTLITGKMDFSNSTKKSVIQALAKADLKALEKAFVPVNKKIDDADLGKPKELQLKSITKTNNGVVVTVGGRYSVFYDHQLTVSGSSLLLNAYDDELNLKFQQIFPIDYTYILASSVDYNLPNKIYPFKNKLLVLGNTKKGTDKYGLYGVLDMNTGQWDSMNYLTNRSVKGYLDANNILWFDKSFTAPYMKYHGSFSIKFDLSLQQNDY